VDYKRLKAKCSGKYLDLKWRITEKFMILRTGKLVIYTRHQSNEIQDVKIFILYSLLVLLLKHKKLYKDSESRVFGFFGQIMETNKRSVKP
jgi:hypothetical protein